MGVRLFATCVAACALAACGSPPEEPGSALALVSTNPAARSVAAARDGVIAMRFDRPLRRDSVTPTSLRVSGRWSGPARGTLGFADGDRSLTFTAERGFAAGEQVLVTLSHDIASADGVRLRSAGHALTFWTATTASAGRFVEVARLDARPEPGVRSRAYGGIASDLNHDGRLDLAIVNEDTADVAVFLNQGGMLFLPAGRAPVGRRASPSEAADFDADGHVDMAVANIADDTVSILRGRGDGSFAPAQTLSVGRTPRGIASLDVDGDGDPDLAVTGTGSSDVTLLVNGGSGFARGASFDAGVDGEWALAAADMDADGVLDLVVGGQQSRQIAVLRGRGDGGFERASVQDAGGAVWMLVTGDLDRNGSEDVAAVNGRTNNAAILLGDGRGGLQGPRMYAIDPFGLASDLGDLDGDGDLDWVTSSYAGDWRMFANAGDGSFALREAFPSDVAASCALPFDADGDGDLDLALIDEEADQVLLLRNQ